MDQGGFMINLDNIGKGFFEVIRNFIIKIVIGVIAVGGLCFILGYAIQSC